MNQNKQKGDKCVPYNETLELKFLRISRMFREGDSTQVISPFIDYNGKEVNQLYGLSWQSIRGDVKGEWPDK